MVKQAVTPDVRMNLLVSSKKLAQKCAITQIFFSPFYILAAMVAPGSDSIAIAFGILAIVISSIPIFFAIKNKSFSILFTCISIFNIAPIWFLYKDSVLPASDTNSFTTPSLRLEAYFWTAIFQFFTNLLYIIFWRKGIQKSLKLFSFLQDFRVKPNFYFRLTLAAFFIPLILFYFYYDSLDTLWLAISAGRSGGGSSGGLLIQDSVGNSGSKMIPVNAFWQLTPLFASIAYISENSKHKLRSFFSLFLGLIVVFVFFLGGSRGTMMFVAAPMLFFLIYYNWQRGIRFWLIAIPIFFFFIGVMELQVRYRGNLLEVIADPSTAAKIAGLSSVTTFDPTQAQQENNMYLLCLILKGVPDKYPFEGFDNLLITLINPIPRAIWPNKPLLGGAKDLNAQPKYILDGPLIMGTTSLTFSVVGEAYLAGGILGIIIYSIIYSIFLILFDGIIYFTRQKQALSVGMLGLSIFLAFWGYRSFFALMTFFYPLIMFILLFKVLNYFQRKKLQNN